MKTNLTLHLPVHLEKRGRRNEEAVGYAEVTHTTGSTAGLNVAQPDS